jgi:hypothetical protein
MQNDKVKLVRLTHRNSDGNYPSGIASDGSGLWITGSDPLAISGALFHYVKKGTQKVYPLPYNPLSLTLDAASNPWFTAYFGGQPSQIVEVLGAK